MARAILHRSKYGTYHPAPDSEIAWAVNDTYGYIDVRGPSCECGACECETVTACDCDCEGNGVACNPDNHKEDCKIAEEAECVGLSFAYVCLDGGASYCEDCFDKLEDRPDIVECDC